MGKDPLGERSDDLFNLPSAIHRQMLTLEAEAFAQADPEMLVIFVETEDFSSRGGRDLSVFWSGAGGGRVTRKRTPYRVEPPFQDDRDVVIRSAD